QERRMTDPGDGRVLTVPTQCSDVRDDAGKRSIGALNLQHRRETQEIESDARPVRRAPEVRVEIPEGAVQTGSAGKLAVLQAPREPYDEDGEQEKREPEREESLRPHSRAFGRHDARAGGARERRASPAAGS